MPSPQEHGGQGGEYPRRQQPRRRRLGPPQIQPAAAVAARPAAPSVRFPAGVVPDRPAAAATAAEFEGAIRTVEAATGGGPGGPGAEGVGVGVGIGSGGIGSIGDVVEDVVGDSGVFGAVAGGGAEDVGGGRALAVSAGMEVVEAGAVVEDGVAGNVDVAAGVGGASWRGFKGMAPCQHPVRSQSIWLGRKALELRDE